MASTDLNIIIEDRIPFVQGAFEPYANVTYLSPEQITPSTVANADALMVRTRTRCDRALLEGSRVKVVATATIGKDHFDEPWLASAGITAANAPGCNAPAVAQYVLASLAAVANRQVRSYVLGIVGVGHVGRVVERWARGLGMKVLLCDPPRQRAEGGDDWVDLNYIAQHADAITFHTPLTRTGTDATWHLADETFFASLRRAPVIINAARGPVVDTKALINAIDAGVTGPVVIDTWEGEPAISLELLKRVDIATCHIAGYSLQGKQRASQMATDAITEALGLPKISLFEVPVPKVPEHVRLTDVLATCDPVTDTAALRAAPDTFEHMRDTYNLRQEPADRADD